MDTEFQELVQKKQKQQKEDDIKGNQTQITPDEAAPKQTEPARETTQKVEEQKVEESKPEAAPEQDDFKKRLEAMLSKGRPPAQTAPAPQKPTGWGTSTESTAKTQEDISEQRFAEMPRFKLQRAASKKFNVENYDF